MHAYACIYICVCVCVCVCVQSQLLEFSLWNDCSTLFLRENKWQKIWITSATAAQRSIDAFNRFIMRLSRFLNGVNKQWLRCWIRARIPSVRTALPHGHPTDGSGSGNEIPDSKLHKLVSAIYLYLLTDFYLIQKIYQMNRWLNRSTKNVSNYFQFWSLYIQALVNSKLT